MIDQDDVDGPQQTRQRARHAMIRPTWLIEATGVVVREDHGAGVTRQRQSQQMTGEHGCAGAIADTNKIYPDRTHLRIHQDRGDLLPIT